MINPSSEINSLETESKEAMHNIYFNTFLKLLIGPSWTMKIIRLFFPLILWYLNFCIHCAWENTMFQLREKKHWRMVIRENSNAELWPISWTLTSTQETDLTRNNQLMIVWEVSKVILPEKVQATEQGKVLAGKLKTGFADRPPPKPHIKFDTYNLICLYIESIESRKLFQIQAAGLV